jgi:hypothetical protein
MRRNLFLVAIALVLVVGAAALPLLQSRPSMPLPSPRW